MCAWRSRSPIMPMCSTMAAWCMRDRPPNSRATRSGSANWPAPARRNGSRGLRAASHGLETGAAAALSRNFRRCRRSPSRQRILGALVQATNVLGLVSFLIHLEIGAGEAVRRELLDGKADGIGGPRKSFVPERLPPEILALRGEQLSLDAVVEQ